MRVSKFKARLTAHGATFAEGSKHTKIYLNGKQSMLPRHPSKELGEGLRKQILKQLGLRDE